jgi:rhodanese-related sulfurtransferase
LPVGRFQAVYAKLKSRMEINYAQPIVIYCEGLQCGASDELASKLSALGYSRVAVFKEGWMAWTDAQLPMEKSEGEDVLLTPWTKKTEK